LSEHSRSVWVRVLFLLGAVWYLYSFYFDGTGVQFETDSPASRIVALALGIFAFAVGLYPQLGRLLRNNNIYLKLAVLVVWLIIGAVVYVFLYTTAIDQPKWNHIYARLFWPVSFGMLLLASDAIESIAKRPEVWLSVGSLMFALILIEVGLQSFLRPIVPEALQSIYFYSAADGSNLLLVGHHYENYVLNPDYESGWREERINSRGFRGEEIEVPKPEGIYRIVAIGGSTTYGTNVSWQDAYPAQLEHVLENEYGYDNVEVINGGVPAHNSWETLINFEFRVLDLDPDLIIVYQNTNDVHARLIDPAEYSGDNQARQVWDSSAAENASKNWAMRVPLITWRYLVVRFRWFGMDSNIEALVQKPCTGLEMVTRECSKLSPEEILDANPPTYYQRNIRSMVGISEVNDVEILLLTWAYDPESDTYTNLPHMQTAFDEQNQIMASTADELGTYFYDFAADMPTGEDYFADGRHMTPEGNRVRAELIAAYIVDAGII